MNEKNDYSKYIGKRVHIKTEGTNRTFIYNGIIVFVGSQLLTIIDDIAGEVDIPLDKILVLIPKEKTYA